MTTKEIKSTLKEKFGLKAVRVTQVGNGKKFLSAFLVPMQFEFPKALRVKALEIVYPDDAASDWVQSGCAGNIRTRYISISPLQWKALLS